MKKIIMLFALILGFNVHAGLIELNLSSSEVTVDDKFRLDIVAEGELETDFFSFVLNFDTNVLNYEELSFISDVKPTVASDYSVSSLPAQGLLFNYFGFFDPVVTVNDGSEIVLANLEFNALAAGSSVFSLSDVEFFKPFAFTPTDIDSRSVASVNINQVPEPQSWLLFAISMLALSVLRKVQGIS